MKTIRGPKKILDAWLEALRSGGYEQGRHMLETPEGRYCCLGVLEHVCDGDVERHSDGLALAMPSPEWLAARRIEFGDACGYSPVISAPAFSIDSGYPSASFLNDTGKSFAEIADLIEAHMEYTDEGSEHHHA